MYKESHSYGKLIMRLVPAIHISYNLEHSNIPFTGHAKVVYREISDPYRVRHNFNERAILQLSCRDCRCGNNWTTKLYVCRPKI